ncbi:AAA family ATPase [Priestia megaterium]|uniref:AAA family ATPase n=1 Tax=Priestia megaterium TaxID=1404 RepID=UPI0011B8528D|nr:ATP-binding protein [Priestia megaterium]QDZ88633.1 hypothetical protein D0441_30795 [Priestia megaterium]
MFIKRIKIEQYGKLKDFEVEFNQSSHFYNSNFNLSVIVGENGTGKTSLLKFISEVFIDHKIKKHFEVDYSISNEKYQISNYTYKAWSMPSKVIVSSYSTFEPYKTAFSKKNPAFNENHGENFEKEVEYVYAGPKRRFGASSLSSVYLPIIKNYIGFNNKKSLATQELLGEIGYVEQPLIEVKRMGIKKRLEKKLSNVSVIRADASILEEDLENIAERMDKFHYEHFERVATRFGSQRKKMLNLNAFEYYEGGVRQWVIDTTKLENIQIDIINDLWFPKGNELIPMKSFSSGELSMFFRFFKLIDTMVDSSVVLIDEPETHLHPRWSRKYIKMLNDIFGHYNCHFIIATHSPLIVSDVPSECIVGLRQIDNFIEQYKVREQTLGINYREILHEVFHIDNLYGEFTNDINKEILRLLKDEKVSAAEELYHKLGDSELKFKLFIKLKEFKSKG